MKPKEIKPDIIYRIINRKTNEPCGSYSRAYYEEFDFESIDEARTANCYGIYKDKEIYKIAKYKVTYELITDDIDSESKNV